MTFFNSFTLYFRNFSLKGLKSFNLPSIKIVRIIIIRKLKSTYRYFIIITFKVRLYFIRT